MKRFLLPFLFLSFSLSACDPIDASTEPPDPDAARVFNVTKTAANTLVIAGVWEGARPETSGLLSSTSRFEFRPTFVVAAAKCTRGAAESAIAGGRAAATVTNELIDIREPISDQRKVGNDSACGVSAAVSALPMCDPLSAPANRTTCFELTGTTLDIYQGGAITSFVKIAD